MSGKQIQDKTLLAKGLVWTLLRYQDGSEFCFQTTLNPDILRERGVVLEDGCLVRLDKKYYVDGRYQYRQFPFDGASISLWDALTYRDQSSYAIHEFL